MTSCLSGNLCLLEASHKIHYGDTVIVVMAKPDLDLVSLIISIGAVAVIVQAGSLAEHFAVSLYSAGIQLALVPDLDLSQPLAGYCRINGHREILEVSHQPLVLPPETRNAPRAYSSNRGLNVRVDGRGPEDIRSGLEDGATGIGIIRTEWLDWESEMPPSIEAHEDLYRSCIDAAGPHLVSFRLLDVGGDKNPAWVPANTDMLESPLGYRGIRARLHPVVGVALDNQLRALTRVAEHAEFSVIVPMVTDPSDIEWVREQLVTLGGPRVLRRVRLGIMVETPASAVLLASLLDGVTSVRIGPGDLTQLTTGKLRSLLGRADYSGHALHPAVIHLIRTVVRTCAERQLDASLCLDVDPRPELLAELISCGLQSICTSASAVNRINSALEALLRSF